MIDNHTEIKRTSSVRYRAIGDETVVVIQHSAELLMLNEIGGRILELLDQPKTLASLVEALQDDYEVDPDTLRIDTVDYILELEKDGVVELGT